MLGTHVKALIPKASRELLATPGGLCIVAIGSVLTYCWDLLKKGSYMAHAHMHNC